MSHKLVKLGLWNREIKETTGYENFSVEELGEMIREVFDRPPNETVLIQPLNPIIPNEEIYTWKIQGRPIEDIPSITTTEHMTQEQLLNYLDTL